MRLIDADAFLARVFPLCEHPQSLKAMVEVEPTVDAVEVVRCKDCAYSDKYCHCSRVDFWTNENDFCSRGKEKT